MLLLWQTASHKIQEEIIMLNKRIMSLSLAALTTAALAAPAFAANETKVTTVYKDITISVTVPGTGDAQINPYGLPVEATKNKSGADPAKISGHQITTQPLYITNDGDIDLSIGATVTTTITTGSNMEIVATAPTSKTTDKQAFVYLELTPSTKTGATTTLTDDEKDALIDEAAEWKKSTYSSTSKTQLLLSTDDPVSKSGMATIKAVTVDSSTKAKSYGAGSIVQFRLDGTVTEEPEEAWSTKDGFTANIAFTFKPASST
jgi:hypothetical protein